MGLCASREEEEEDGVRLATADTDAIVRSLGGDGKCVLLKVLLLGTSGVGKTSLIGQYCKGEFKERYKSTIGSDFATKDLSVDDRYVTLQIWDTAGQERFQSLGVAFYRGSDCCVLVYDVNNRESFKSLHQWMQEFLIHAGPDDPEKFPFLVLGNKVDLCRAQSPGTQPRRKPEVSEDEAKEWCKKHGNIPHLLVSAKEGTNLDEAFTLLADIAIQRLHAPLSTAASSVRSRHGKEGVYSSSPW